ncbi:MAG: DUF6046 domain-containing protein [Prevotellaceae bacterium]|jgi:hypothetical protein|nr:DUF6046 domain-containing protein [Prevotellaceae bacterium]
MSSLINIHIPKHAAKELEYNALKVAKEVGSTIRTKIYDGLISPALDRLDDFTDQLRADGGLNENNVVLCTNRGVLIEFIDAKIDVTKQHTLVETALVSRGGKVKERIQADDYIVKISGSLMSERDRFPYQDLVLLNQILNEARSINVASVYLYAFGITKLALKTADFKQSELKAFNVMPFTLNFVSDRDYSFKVGD